MQIRKATMKDAEALLSLYEDLGYPTTASKLARRLKMILSQPHYGCLLSERNGEILGFLGYAKFFFFEADGSYYRILALSVAKEARRQGIATALMDKVKKIASQDGANDERLAAHAQNYVFRQTSLAFARNVEEDEHGKEKS
ncbi:GNAT family N-acetyltransferase [uncultured Streptococcus sp.]|uniref:GNAT family N-acetyltransferase n=1 Tax=uncultured Streptococcus sp. TaxID=83427 RepID=UPI0028EA5156|nr:GNAT family N-acetyltransferase [uncultured Streptococcus sp.]